MPSFDVEVRKTITICPPKVFKSFLNASIFVKLILSSISKKTNKQTNKNSNRTDGPQMEDHYVIRILALINFDAHVAYQNLVGKTMH